METESLNQSRKCNLNTSPRLEYYIIIIIIIIIINSYLLTAIEFSLGGSGHYSSGDTNNKNEYT